MINAELKNHTYKKKDSHNLIFMILLSILSTFCIIYSAIVLSSAPFAIFYLLVVSLFVSIFFFHEHLFGIKDNAYLLNTIIAFSAFQSLVIGYFIADISATNVKIITGTSFLLPIMFFVYFFKKLPFYFQDKDIRHIVFLSGIIFSYSIVTWFVFRAPAISAVASLRNIIGPFLFFIIGISASRTCNRNNFLRIILYIGMVVILIGVLERFVFDRFWVFFNLNELLDKKGLSQIIRYNGLPTTWYSAEKIGSNFHIRRMASSFADPVNLGTFLFFVFLSAYVLKNKILQILSIISILLVVSKGGILCLLIFFSFYYYFRYKKLAPIAILLVALGGFYLFIYVKNNSTGSMMAHIQGLLNAFYQLPQNPFGHGLGSTGVLQNLFRTFKFGTDISESGLGVIIGQLGFIGLAVFIFFFLILYKNAAEISDQNTKLIFYTAVTGIAINIMFNEVALSPNSSATYFIFIGLVIGQEKYNLITQRYKLNPPDIINPTEKTLKKGIH